MRLATYLNRYEFSPLIWIVQSNVKKQKQKCSKTNNQINVIILTI
jgi:hypothetical protein